MNIIFQIDTRHPNKAILQSIISGFGFSQFYPTLLRMILILRISQVKIRADITWIRTHNLEIMRYKQRYILSCKGKFHLTYIHFILQIYLSYCKYTFPLAKIHFILKMSGICFLTPHEKTFIYPMLSENCYLYCQKHVELVNQYLVLVNNLKCYFILES